MKEIEPLYENQQMTMQRLLWIGILLEGEEEDDLRRRKHLWSWKLDNSRSPGLGLYAPFME